MAGKGKGKGKKGKEKKKRGEKKRIEQFQPRNLPEDAVTEILLRFPIKSVLRFRCVSKKWCAKIDSPEFKKKHLAYQLVRYDDEFLVVNREYSVISDTFGCHMNVLSCYDDFKSLSDLNSSCDLDINSMYFSSFSYHINGVVCVIRDPGWNVYLCNPALREIRQLPAFPRFPVRLGIRCPYLDSAIGIGFDDAADDYVVVRFVHDGGDSDSYDLKCVSYHVKTKSWTMIEMPRALVSAYASTLKKRYASITKLYASCFSHGCIHWCMDWCHIILTLNMDTKLFQEIEFPRGWKGYGYREYVYLLSVDSSSSIALFGTRGRDLHNIDVWVMKEYGVADSWTRQYLISDYTIPGLAPAIHGLPRISRPLCFWRKDKVFMLTLWRKLICYDLGKGQLYEYPLRGEPDPKPCPEMKAIEVVTAGGQKKLLLLPDADKGEGQLDEPPRRGHDNLCLPHPDMKTLEVVACTGSLISVYRT